MEFITLREGLKVRMKDIESVEDVIEGISQAHSTLVTMRSGKDYTTFWPLETLMQLLEMEDSEEPKTVRLDPQVEGALINQDKWAG